MSNIQTGAERMPHDLSHLGFLAGQIGRLITISTTPVIAGDSFEKIGRASCRERVLILGVGASVEEIRTGAEEAGISGVFDMGRNVQVLRLLYDRELVCAVEPG